MTANGIEFILGGYENVLKLILVMVVYLYEYVKTIEMYTLSGRFIRIIIMIMCIIFYYSCFKKKYIKSMTKRPTLISLKNKCKFKPHEVTRRTINQ